MFLYFMILLSTLFADDNRVHLDDINFISNTILKGREVGEQKIQIQLLSEKEWISSGKFMSLAEEYDVSLVYFKELVLRENKQQRSKYLFCNEVGFYVYLFNEADFTKALSLLSQEKPNIEVSTSHLSYYNPEKSVFASIVCFTCESSEESFYSYLLRQNCTPTKERAE